MNQLPPGWLRVPTAPKVRGVVTTRHHPQGSSAGEFSDFNLGTHVGDEATAVASNRLALSNFVGDRQIQWLNQVHGTACIEVLKIADVPPVADAARTTNSGIALAVMTADCLPILLWDEHGQEIAVCHAGWQGLVAGVIEQTLAALDSKNHRVSAWIGPSIGREHYEVGEDVWSHFAEPAEQEYLGEHAQLSKRWLDLPGLARYRLENLGVRQVLGAGKCTYADARYYSHRRHMHGQDRVRIKGRETCGRFASLLWLA